MVLGPTAVARSSTGAAFGARVRGTFTPDDSGAWEFGANAVGPLTLRLDGETLIDIPAGEHGGAFYGLGSHEHRATVELDAGGPTRSTSTTRSHRTS